MPRWESLIETSYAIVGPSQCPQAGLAELFKPETATGGAGRDGCSGQHTAAEYGSEAARTSWRFALHWILYGDRARLPSASPWPRMPSTS